MKYLELVVAIWQGVDEWFVLPAEGEQRWDGVAQAPIQLSVTAVLVQQHKQK